MPVLNPQVLRDIALELLKRNDYPSKNLMKFALSGKDQLAAFEGLMASVKSVKISGALMLVKFVSLTFTFPDYSVPFSIVIFLEG